MYLSIRYKLTVIFSSLILTVAISLALFSSTRGMTHAAGVSLKPSVKSESFSITLMSNCGGWKVVASPNLGGAGWASLSDVVSITASNIWSVGYYRDNANIDQTLAEHWDGT